ncbi:MULTISPECIES: hypothetical protein [Nocardioides]|nr:MULTISPECIES: hypothetical protein [unclassified Nocardioides]
MRSLLHVVAQVVVVLVSAWCLLVQVAHVDQAWSGVRDRTEATAR